MIRRAIVLSGQQRFDFGGGVALALSFFFQHSEELLKNPKPVVSSLTAKQSRLVDGDAIEERVILIALQGGGSGTVTIRRQVQFLDTAAPNQWSVASASGNANGVGQINWKPKE